MRKRWIVGTLLLLVSAVEARAEFHKAEHPYILWTKEEAAAIKKKIATETWAQEQVKALPNNPFGRLFRYQILGDEKAGDEERKYLLTFIDAPLDGKGDSGSAGLHTANYLHAIRYDIFYDTLTPEQRSKLEATFRKHVREELPFSTPVGRAGILPNLALPRRCGVLMMTVALQDEALIKELADKPRSLKWFLEDYLADGQFYGEEFSKMTSIIGEFLLYARGLDRIGMSDYGFDFKGKNGATLKRYVESYLSIQYPRADMPGPPPAAPVYARISMGDARGGGLFQGVNAPQTNREGGGLALYYSANMNGRDHSGRKIDKLNFPQWFEILAARYPNDNDADRFMLTCLRNVNQDRYIPTLFWGLDPIEAATVKPPPAPSWVAPERGLAFLRADESPAYWSGRAPAVALQFAQMYVHNTSDCFSLLGYYAFNRPIYVNRAISAGYNGGPWDFHVRGHAGVVVDNQQAQPIGVVPSRSDFSSQVKFVSARGVTLVPLTGRGEARPTDQPKEAVTEVYSDMDLSRSLFLTRDYLVDVYDLRDKKNNPRDFYWMVHAPGSVVDRAGEWKATEELQKKLFHTPWQNPLPPEQRTREGRLYDAPPSGTDGPDWVTIGTQQRLDAGKNSVVINTQQTYHGEDVEKSKYGADWYGRKIGVRVSMLPAATDTTAYTFSTPTRYTPGSNRSSDSKDARVIDPEFGGVSVAIHRRAPATTFVALHEPYEKGATPKSIFKNLAQTDDGVAVSVVNPDAGVNDRVLLQYDRRDEAAVKAIPELEKDSFTKPLTLTSADGESFTFVGHAFVRIGPEKVEATGNLSAIRLAVKGSPKLLLNGKDVSATIANGMLKFP